MSEVRNHPQNTASNREVSGAGQVDLSVCQKDDVCHLRDGTTKKFDECLHGMFADDGPIWSACDYLVGGVAYQKDGTFWNGCTPKLNIVRVTRVVDGVTVQISPPPPPAPAEGEGTFQRRVHAWMLTCFGEAIASDLQERCHRFLEESLEWVQSHGCTPSEAHQLVDYVFGRPVGDPRQELGGVLVTAAAMATAAGLNCDDAGETELKRVWGKVEQIRAKQAAKPKHSPLPATPPAPSPPSAGAEGPDDFPQKVYIDLLTAAERLYRLSVVR